MTNIGRVMDLYGATIYTPEENTDMSQIKKEQNDEYGRDRGSSHVGYQHT